METKKPFLTWVFCDPDGTPSFARVGTLMLMAAVVGWDSAYIALAWRWNTQHLAPGQAPLALFPDPLILAAQVGFFTALYGANKFAAIWTKQ